MRSVTWNRFPIKNLRWNPCLFHLRSEVTCPLPCWHMHRHYKDEQTHIILNSSLIRIRPTRKLVCSRMVTKHWFKLCNTNRISICLTKHSQNCISSSNTNEEYIKKYFLSFSIKTFGIRICRVICARFWWRHALRGKHVLNALFLNFSDFETTYEICEESRSFRRIWKWASRKCKFNEEKSCHHFVQRNQQTLCNSLSNVSQTVATSSLKRSSSTTKR